MNKNKTSQKRKPSRQHSKIPAWKIVLAVLVILLLVLIAAGASFLKFYKPSVDTGVPFETGSTTPVPGITSPKPGETTDDTEPAIEVFQRNTDVVNFLIIGRDAISWNTDVIMLVNFNMREGSLAIMQFPRDTYINFENARGRINTMFVSMRTASYSKNSALSQNELNKAGMAKMCEELEKSLCIQIDGYAHINLEGFRAIIDTIGGVYMDVPNDMDYEDPEQDLYIHLKAGPQLLNGEKAEMFVRFRSGYVQADIGRIDAQKMFLTALFKQLKSSMTVTTIAKIAEQVFKYVTTDIPLADVIIYAKNLLGVDMDKISMMTIHGSAIQTETGAWYYATNRAAALDMINNYFNVYNTQINNDIFDKNKSFSNETSTVFKKIYYAAADDPLIEIKPDVHTGEDIDNGELNIPIIK